MVLHISSGSPFEASIGYSRAVVAGTLLKERDTVVARLRRMGVYIVETKAANVGPAVINAYLDLKRRDLL